MADRRANANVMINVITYYTKIHVKDLATSDIKKIDTYITIFAYTTTASRKQDYQDQKIEQCSINYYMDK